MASSGGALNLSLLSRGVGEISKNGHERIDVVFEPQDYFNFVGTSSRLYLPPIPNKYDYDGTPTSKSSKFKISQDIPKTFTTRKGALLLFSEDLAGRGGHGEVKHRRHRKPHPTELSLEVSKSAEELELKTVDDLAKSILSFGGKESSDDTDIYLGFVHNTYGRRKKDLFERQIRPGFSAKRYLSLWTKSWDDNVLGKVISKGYLTEKSLFYYNPLNPHLQRRLNDDMSHYPAPYKLMRSMLMSPGSLSGYTFYRVRPESADTIAETPEEADKIRSPSQMGSIKVISTKDGVQREVSYSTLDKAAQEEVLTDLLVKSAVHYAMKKQQELIEESQRERAIEEVDEERSSIQQFDMRDAVESLLDSQKGKGAINPDFADDKSDVSSRSGSIKGKSIKRKKDKESTESSAATSPLPADYLSEQDKEYVGNVPVASVRGDGSSVPQLPHIAGAAPLTPIGEASREGTRMTIPVSLPPIHTEHGIDEPPRLTVLPPTPQHSTITSPQTTSRIPVKEFFLHPPEEVTSEEFSDESGVGVRTDRTGQTDRRHYSDSERRRRSRKSGMEESGNQTGPSLSGGYHLHSSTESLGGPASSHSYPASKPLRAHWKGSTQSLKSDRSKKGSGSLPEDGSVKGSIVIGPDGEPINVGGHIDAHIRPDLLHHIENVGDANRHFGRDLVSDYESDDEPDAWKRRRGVQREDMRNYANKREKLAPPQRKVVIPPRQPSLKSKSSSANKTVRFSTSSKDEGFEEIDYTAGDIDATLSMSSWSYMPRDNDPEFAGIVQQMNRASSLPGTFMRAEISKDFTLSRATEKTEEGLSGDGSPMKQVSHISVPHDDTSNETPETTMEPAIREDTEVDGKAGGSQSQMSHHSEGVHSQRRSTPGMGPQSRAGSRASFQNRRSSSQIDVRSGSRISFKADEGRRSSMSDLDRRGGSLSRRESRLSKISLQSINNEVGIEPVVEPVEEVESEKEAASTRSPDQKTESVHETDDKEESLHKDESHKSATSRRSKSSLATGKESAGASQSPFGTVAPSRPGSQRTGSDHVSGPTGMDLSPSPPIKTPPPTQASVRPGAADPEVKLHEGERSRVQSVAGPASEPEGSGQSIQSGQISEKDIIDVLENTARQVAASTLSRSDSGQDLERDARQAAELWLEKNAPRIISRSQSVQDVQGDNVAIKSAAENGRKSAGPTAGEYKDLIKEKLQTALSNTDGESIPVIPDDAELSPELLEALQNNSLSPEDLEVVKDEETGKSIVRSRSQMSAAMGGVKEGHIYVPVAKNGQKQPGSIPTDRQSNADIGEFEVINYGGKSSDSGSKVGSAKTHSSKDKSEKMSDKAPSEKSSEKGGKSQPPSILGESIVEEDEQDDRKSQRSGQRSEDGEVEEPEDEFKKAVEEVEKAQEDRKSGVSRKSDDKKSVASSDDKKSKVSVKTEKSDAKKTPVKKEEFVVGKVKQKNEMEALYGDISPAPAKGSTPPGEEKKEDSPKIAIQPPLNDPKLPPLPDDISKLLDRGQKSKKFDPTAKTVPATNLKSPKKPPAADEKRKVSTKGELEKLFGEYGLPPPKPSGPKKKGKPKDGKGKKPGKKPAKATKGKGKAKDEEPKQAQTAEEEPEPVKEPTPPPVLPPEEEKAMSDNESDKTHRSKLSSKSSTAKSKGSSFYTGSNLRKFQSKESIAETHKTEESSDFEFIRDTPSPSPPPPPKPPSTIPSVDDEPTDDEEKQEGEDDGVKDEAARLRMISNREARAAKRAAQAAKRKEEVERKRREKEEQARREKDEQERAEQLKREMEEERRRVMEAKRQKKMEEEAEREREAQMEEEKLARQKAEAEREKRRKEEYQRKLDEMKRKQAEEEQKRYEEQMERLREEEEKRKAEEAMMALMAEEERKEYERKKKEEEEARRKKEEEERRRREEEAQRAMEEARKLAEEMARRQAELEARLKFNRELQVEARGLDHSHNITEAFVFSYFELLNWFGLDIPEFEMLKINQY